MLKVFSFSTVVILLLSSVALANISQSEGYSIGAFNNVERVGSASSAEGGNMVMVGHSQEAHVPYRGGVALQDETGILTQGAGAVGIPTAVKCCALHKERRAIPKLRLRFPPVCDKYRKPSNLMHLVGKEGATYISQNASIDGLQDQLIEGYKGSLLKEGQLLKLNLGQKVHKFGGIGGAVGAQGFVGDQNQIIDTPGQFSAESQFVGAVQYAAVAGGPCSKVFVDNNLDVRMDQDQMITGRPVRPRPCRPPCDP